MRSPRSRASTPILYESLPAETGIETGMRRHGAVTVARTPGRMTEIPVRRRHGAGLRHPGRGPHARRVRAVVAGGGDRGPGRRGELPDRRHREPGRRGVVPREGREGPRRSVRPGRDRHGVPPGCGRRSRHRASRPTGDRSRPRPWCWRRVVDERARAPRGRQRRAVPGRARLGHDRARRGRARRGTVPARPRRLPLHPPSPRQFRDRSVRAQRQADRRRPRPHDRVRGVRPGLGPLRARARERPPAAPGTARRSASRTTCGRPRASRPTRRSSWGSSRRSRAYGSRRASTRRASSTGRASGMALAEWIVEGHPTYDLADVDIARMGRWANNRGWLHERTVESLGGLYEMHWPGKQPVTARGVRRIPLYERMRAAGAAFGQAGGWERANWFEPGAVDPGVALRLRRAVVVRRGAGRGPRDARRRRPVRPVHVLQVRGRGAGRVGGPAAAVRVRRRRAGRAASSTRCSATSAAGSRWTPP